MPNAQTSMSRTGVDVGANVALTRVEVRLKPGRLDPRAEHAVAAAAGLGVSLKGAHTARVYLIEGALSASQVQRVVGELLTDHVVEVATVGAAGTPSGAATVEVHPLPGVMDPAARSVMDAIRDLTGVEVAVSTGVRYDLTGFGVDEGVALVSKTLANPAIHQISGGVFLPKELPRGNPSAFKVRSVSIRGLSDEELMQLSRRGHLFLSLEEMRAVQAEFERRGREPTDIELETLAQTWSEHCVHKTLKSRVSYRSGAGETLKWAGRPGVTVQDDGTVVIENLLKSTVARATFDLIDQGIDWTLSVFKDNSGVIAFDDAQGVCIKVETHNRPSAIEPYGGAATGAGGCIRDVIGTGRGAKPIANTDVFCVAHPGAWAVAGSGGDGKSALPPGTLHPKRILTEVVAGVRDYGNRMGIPTVNGAVHFDNRFVGNPLVFCGCIGLIPRGLIKGEVRPGDRIIALGGKTGRDGIHGATFSSAELEQTASTEFSHAVQIGNAIEEKRVLDAILRARDIPGGPLYHAMTDCGAGGFSSAVGEMGSKLGARVRLENAPTKYAGLSYTEIWISEAQERMVLAVPAANVPALQRICDEEHVELADLGEFGTENGELILTYHGTEVGRMSMEFIHDGIPTPLRSAEWSVLPAAKAGSGQKPTVAAALDALLAHPSIASKHWIVRQYDHEVQGNSVVKPLCGVGGRGPSDASVIAPVAGSDRGIAMACGLHLGAGDASVGGDPYQLALAGIDEAIRNLVCVGADPERTAILDNFCWPSCEKPRNLGALVRACMGCYDGAMAYRTPFVSGKDSLNNQLRYTDPMTGEAKVIEIPFTLLVTGLSIVPDVSRAVTMDAKRAGNVLLLVGPSAGALGGSTYNELFGRDGSAVPEVDLKVGPATAKVVSGLIRDGLVASAHDCSEGGLLCAVAEMLIATTGGATKPLGAAIENGTGMANEVFAFAEGPSRYVLEVTAGDVSAVETACLKHGIPVGKVGNVTASGVLEWPAAGLAAGVDGLAATWRGTLDW